MDFMAIEIVNFPIKHGDFSSSFFVNVYQRVTRMGKPWLICQMISKKLIDHDLSTCSLIMNHAQVNLRMGNMLMLINDPDLSICWNMLDWWIHPYVPTISTILDLIGYPHEWTGWTVGTLSHADLRSSKWDLSWILSWICLWSMAKFHIFLMKHGDMGMDQHSWSNILAGVNMHDTGDGTRLNVQDCSTLWNIRRNIPNRLDRYFNPLDRCYKWKIK